MNFGKQLPDDGERDPPVDKHDVTQLLSELGLGKQESLPLLIPQVYKELRKLAHSFMRKEGPNHTLQTTELVHEAYLRLHQTTNWKDRAEFFKKAASVMRWLLVDYARRKRTEKRGGEIDKITLPEEGEVCSVPLSPRQSTMLLALDEALTRFTRISRRQSKVIELRFFEGMTVDETAQVLGVDKKTVHRDWQKARAWLNREMGGQ